MFDTDHLNTFFLDALPIFAVGIDKSFKAPNDEPRDVPNYIVPSLPAWPRISAPPPIAAGYDVGMTQNFSVDHSVTVPLHFLTPDMQVPVIPFFISGHVPPLPSAQRCYALGQAVARAIESWPEPLRVVVMGIGQLLARSRRSAHGARPLRRRARSGLGDARHQAARGAEDRPADRRSRPSISMLKAGNVGGELLNWIAMLGAIGNRKPNYVAPQMQNGHAYGVWRWN